MYVFSFFSKYFVVAWFCVSFVSCLYAYFSLIMIRFYGLFAVFRKKKVLKHCFKPQPQSYSTAVWPTPGLGNIAACHFSHQTRRQLPVVSFLTGAYRSAVTDSVLCHLACLHFEKSEITKTMTIITTIIMTITSYHQNYTSTNHFPFSVETVEPCCFPFRARGAGPIPTEPLSRRRLWQHCR